ncbi:MAG: imidazole glycerol phosphate synthase subunit HisH [Chloroflexi bacterium]|nr:imidazole glycerol phosphate synthase subunit HisH [Chloroflexota bacterium]
MAKQGTIAVIDYGAGNLRSVINAITRLGYQPRVTRCAEDILAAQMVILPGVGAAGTAMTNLAKLGLIGIIRRLAEENRPFLGICLGLQVLFEETEEGGGAKCLGIFPGKVRRLPPGLKIPHMGWNQVKQRVVHPVFDGIPDNADFYFVHSYYAVPEDGTVIAGETDYGITFCSAVARGNLVATQFHPEKSGELGLKIYANLLALSQLRN